MSNFLQKLKSKSAFLAIIGCFIFLSNVATAQVFWSEDFTAPTWTLNVQTGVNAADSNFFKISDDEGGGIIPNLGAPASCGVANNGNNTLYITSTFAGGGAAYNAGGFCNLGICVTSNLRAESPSINCSGKINITLDFNYIENGDGNIDDAFLWYFDGTSWSIIGNMPKTLTGCAGQGLWTSYTLALPASANNNPNIKIGFGWVNNDDGLGTDPSFAVDDIKLSTSPAGGLTTDALAILTYCSCSPLNIGYFTNAVVGAGNIFTAQLSDEFGSFAAPTVIGTLPSLAPTGTIPCVIPCNAANGTHYRIRVVSSNPAMTGTDNGADITINTTPTVTIQHIVTNCMDTLKAIATGGVAAPIPGTKYFIRNQNPWGSSAYDQGLNAVFGVGGWTPLSYAAAVPATVFAPSTQFVYIEGSDGNAIAMNNYITANITTIENWVNSGGRLIMNSAPNQGGNMNWGFGGVTLNYNNAQGTVNVVAGDPIGLGPFLPAGYGPFTGSSYSHAHITGGGVVPMIIGGGYNVLTKLQWGSGLVLFGGYTAPSFHSPLPNAQNLFQNWLDFTANSIAGAPLTFLWQPTGAVTPTIVPPTSGIYTVTVTNANCVGTATINVTLSPPPPVVTANANPGSVCPGNMTTLTGGGTPGVTYTWTGGVVDGVPFAPPVTTTYTVTGTNANGCTATSTVTVTVNGNLTITVTPPAPGICQGGSDTLYASGATTYQWFPGGFIGNPFIVSPAATTQYTVTGNNGPNCSGTTVVTVSVAGIDSLTISLVGPPCSDTLKAHVVVSGQGGGVAPGAKYYIQDNNPWGSPSNINEMNAVFGVGNWIQGTYATPPATIYVPSTQFVFLEGGDFNQGFPAYMTANITLIEGWVNQGGRLFCNAAPNYGVNQNWGFGGTILNYQNLIPAMANAVPGVIVTNLAHPINQGPYLPVSPGGVYTANYFAHADIIGGGTTLIHSAANPAQAVLTEKVWGNGLVAFGGMTTTNWHNNVAPLVNADAINLRKNILYYVAGSPLPAPPVVITWQPGGATGATFVPPASGIYTVTVSVNGCTSTATVNYVKNVPPVVVTNATPNTTCPNGNVVLTASGGATYVWQPGNLNGATQNVNPATTTTYTVTVTSAAGCTSTGTVLVTIGQNLPIVATATPDNICLGGTSQLVATGGVTYNWQPGNLNGASQTVSPIVTTTYTVVGTDPVAGCTGMTTVQVTIVQTPVLTVTVTPSPTFCIGEPVTITANGALNYTWTGGITNGVPYYPVANATYTVTGSNNNGCDATATISLTAITPQAPNVNIVSNPAPTIIGQFAGISAIVPAYIPNYILNWYVNNTWMAQSVSPNNTYNYVPNTLADNVYAYLTAVGCYDPDSVKSNIINPRNYPAGLDNIDIPEGFAMYPNPTSNIIYIEGIQAGDEMILSNVMGQAVMHKKFSDSNLKNINLDALAVGIYHAKFVRKDKSWVVKVRKQ